MAHTHEPLLHPPAAAPRKGSIKQRLESAFQEGIDAAFPALAGQVGAIVQVSGGLERPVIAWHMACIEQGSDVDVASRKLQACVESDELPVLVAPKSASGGHAHRQSQTLLPSACPATCCAHAAVQQPQVWRLPVQQRHGAARPAEGAGVCSRWVLLVKVLLLYCNKVQLCGSWSTGKGHVCTCRRKAIQPSKCCSCQHQLPTPSSHPCAAA